MEDDDDNESKYTVKKSGDNADNNILIKDCAAGSSRSASSNRGNKGYNKWSLKHQ